MKTLICTLIIVATTLSAVAQGRVAFLNYFGGPVNSADAITIYSINQGSSGGLAGQGIGGNQYSVQLVWVAGTGLTQGQFDAGVQHVGVACTGVGTGSASAAFFSNTGNIASGAGLFDAGLIPSPVGTSMPAGGYTAQVLAWYSVGGLTYAAAISSNKNFGKSALFNVDATTAPSTANSTIFPGFQVGFDVPIPEPSTLSLAALGAAVLLFRRKK